MVFWRDLNLNKKIGVIIGILLFIIIGMTGLFYLRLEIISKDMTYADLSSDLNSVVLAREIDHWRWISSLQRYVYDESLTDLTIQEDGHKCGFGQWYYGPDRASAETAFPKISEPLRLIEQAHLDLHASATMIKNLKSAGNTSEAHSTFEQISLPHMQAVQRLLEQIGADVTEIRTQSMLHLGDAISRSVLYMIAIAIGAIVIGLALGICIARSITSPILKIASYVRGLSEGHFEVKFAVDRRDELGHLEDDLNRMADKISEVITNMQAVTASVVSGSEELSSTAQIISQGAVEQAASVEEISASMEEMSSNIKHTSDNAQQTERAAQKSAKDTHEGGEAVTKTVAAMKQIAEKIIII